MSHIPEDRHKHGLVLDYSLEQNMVLQRYYEPEFQKFVLSEVKAKVTDKITFDKALEDYIKANTQYIASDSAPKTFFKNSSVPLENGAGENKGVNAKMNAIFRNSRK